MPNTIADNLARLQTARTDIANAITTMGGTVSAGDGFEDFPAEILGIPAGSQIVEGVLTPNNPSSYAASKVWGCEGFIFGYIKALPLNGMGIISGIDFPSTTPSTYVFYCAGSYYTKSYGGQTNAITSGYFNFSTGKVSFSSSNPIDADSYAYLCFIITW